MSITRREWLASAAAVAVVRPAVPNQIKAYCIDFNWYKGAFAPPGHWADASPEAHVEWYAALGANTIQTFCVSCNGYAWYKNGMMPAQPGLRSDFLTEVVRLGHRRGMLVMGYFCVGANTRWGLANPALSYGAPPNSFHIPFTGEYLDFLGRSMEDAIRRTGLDGYMIDWVWNPPDKLREKGWLPAEKKLYTELTGKPFPASGRPEAADKLAYERRSIERAWERIRAARDRANPGCVLWLSCSRLDDPTVIDSRLLRESDWVMNEAPSRALLDKARKMIGPRTRLIQNLVGWPDHDARGFLADPANRKIDFYGFAEPRDTSLPLSVSEYLGKPVDSFAGKERFTVNDRNTAVLARFYRGLAMN